MARRKISPHAVTVESGTEFTWPNTFHGRKLTFKIAPMRGGIYVRRGGRRGGVRGERKVTGGMVVCQPTRGAPGTKSTHCLRSDTLFIYAGGGAKTRKWDVQLHGLRTRRRRKGRR
jgi:hypothetical protein